MTSATGGRFPQARISHVTHHPASARAGQPGRETAKGGRAAVMGRISLTKIRGCWHLSRPKVALPGTYRGAMAGAMERGPRFVSPQDTAPPSHERSPMSQPVRQLTTSRGLVLWIVFTCISFGLYPLFAFSNISSELNLMASARDGRNTLNGALMFLILAPLTLGIAGLVWFNNICGRMEGELAARNIGYRFGPTTFWGWGFLGCLIVIGPLVFLHKFCKAMNLLNASYNTTGPSVAA